jgi:hypothetical protein
MNCKDRFKIICATLDFDDESEKPIPMREDALIIEKKGTVIYQQPRDESTDMLEGVLGAH